MGGAHIPALVPEKSLSTNQDERPISICSDDSDLELLELPACSSATLSKFMTAKRNRLSESARFESPKETTHFSKKRCIESPHDVSHTGRQKSNRDVSIEYLRPVIDLQLETVNKSLTSSILNPKASDPSLFGDDSGFNAAHLVVSNTDIDSSISLWSSEIATPPPTGAIISNDRSTRGQVIRLPGQMLTFGDAFCGAGGTTRGAVMAGLKVKWGFDFWDNACATWKANFNDAECYCMPSEEFVAMAQNPDCDELVKVDILHLSPPCQYFSPAHTVNGVDDEMNTASLYAVLEVVKAVKPRVVTLEQTFGILGAKCRWYFSSVIHMFALLRFSVRWAIVPLSTWVCI